MGRISNAAATLYGKKENSNPRADSTRSSISSTASSTSTSAPPTSLPSPPLTPQHAAPRRLTRTLSCRGGDDVTEALHIELERSLLQVVDVPIEKQRHGKALAAESTELHPPTSSTSSSINPSQCSFALAKPSVPNHYSVQNSEEFNRPLTSLDCTQGPYVLGDGVCHTTFTLFPLLEGLSHKSRKALLQSLLDPSPKRNLEKAGKINWHPECASLVALRTESDGNCLAHAASLGCWGVHDRKLLLRNAMRSFLVGGAQGQGQGQGKMAGGKRLLRLIRKSWEEELGKHGVVLEKGALDIEWAVLAKQAENAVVVDGLAATTGSNNDKQLQHSQTPQSPQSPQNQQLQQPEKKGGIGNGSFAYLEATHIYVLAHVLRRPLIVFATDWTDAKGRQLASAEEIAGVYLPLELPRHVCSRTPLVLAYDSFHFSPLVPVDPSRLSQVPLVSSSTQRDQLLPLPFYAPSERSMPLRTAVLKHYLDCGVLADGVLVVKIEDRNSTTPQVGHAFSPFSASSFPANGLLSLLLSNVIEDEEFQQNGTILSHGGSLSRCASARTMAVRASSFRGSQPSSSFASLSSLSSNQRMRGGGGLVVGTPLHSLSLGSFASSSRTASSSSLNAQLLHQPPPPQQQQQRKQQEEQEQQVDKSSSCSALGSSANIAKKSSISKTNTTTKNSSSSGSSSSSSSGSSSFTKREQYIIRQLREHKDLVLALEEVLKRSKKAERQQQQHPQQHTLTAPSPLMTPIAPTTIPLSEPSALLLATAAPSEAGMEAPAISPPLRHNWLAALRFK